MTHGTLRLENGRYVLTTEPHVRMPVKRLFLGCKAKGNTLSIQRSHDSTENLLWILQRWPHETSPGLLDAMRARVISNKESRETAAGIIAGTIEAPAPPDWNEQFPLRDYQRKTVALSRIKGGILCGDDLGLGKTATAIGVIADRGERALVVCPKHVQLQWAAQIGKFCPSLKTHILKQNAPYELPRHDVTICSYAKLPAWSERRKWPTVIYDEVQELRHAGTSKYQAAEYLATASNTRIGLSATPVYNNAGEIYNVMEALSPGTLGTLDEFASEWAMGTKLRIEDPVALGSWLRGQSIFIRHRRSEVGRELPPLLKINHIVDHDPKILDRLREQANELAERVLNASFHERGKSARQLDIMLRQTTGIAKAIQVADFVAELVENGEQILLAGWHHQVYEIWRRHLTARGIEHRSFTGEESSNEKAKAAADFIDGTARVLIMSLRSGAGLDGLQTASRTVVVGELDWSPQVIEQLVGRLRRDGQEDQVTVFTMMADSGADPIMASVLGGKWEQSTSLTDPDKLTGEPTAVPTNRIAELAKAWLHQQNKRTA